MPKSSKKSTELRRLGARAAQSVTPRRTRRGRPRRVGRPGTASGAVPSREAVLEAALEAFGAVGYDAMSVRDLTRRLGVSHSLVHHYFGSKAELWRAAIDYSFGSVTRQMIDLLQSAPVQGDVVGMLRQSMVQFLIVTARFPANGHIIVRESAIGGPRLDYIYERYTGPALEPWFALLRQAQADGKVRPDLDMRTLFFLLTDGGAGPYTSRGLASRIGGPEAFQPEAIRAHAELVADILMRGIVVDGVATAGNPR